MNSTKGASSKLVGFLVAIPFAVGGLGMLIGGAYWYFVVWKFVATAKTAEGTVISLVYHRWCTLLRILRGP